MCPLVTRPRTNLSRKPKLAPNPTCSTASTASPLALVHQSPEWPLQPKLQKWGWPTHLQHRLHCIAVGGALVYQSQRQRGYAGHLQERRGKRDRVVNAWRPIALHKQGAHKADGQRSQNRPAAPPWTDLWSPGHKQRSQTKRNKPVQPKRTSMDRSVSMTSGSSSSATSSFSLHTGAGQFWESRAKSVTFESRWHVKQAAAEALLHAPVKSKAASRSHSCSRASAVPPARHALLDLPAGVRNAQAQDCADPCLGVVLADIVCRAAGGACVTVKMHPVSGGGSSALHSNAAHPSCK